MRQLVCQEFHHGLRALSSHARGTRKTTESGPCWWGNLAISRARRIHDLSPPLMSHKCDSASWKPRLINCHLLVQFLSTSSPSFTLELRDHLRTSCSTGQWPRLHLSQLHARRWPAHLFCPGDRWGGRSDGAWHAARFAGRLSGAAWRASSASSGERFRGPGPAPAP